MREDQARGPLTGIRVLEMAALGPVPFAAMLLADLGADVVRVDRPGNPPGLPIPTELDIMARGRRRIQIDSKHTRGRAIVLDLVEQSDVLIEGMRPGAMERLGLGPTDCMQRNPALVYARMTGWGQTGPLAEKAGHDINYIALNGVLDAIGEKNGPPVPPLALVGDYGGGAMFVLVGILSALLQARSSGKGQVIDAAMLEGSSYLMTAIDLFTGAGLWSAERGSNLLDGGAPFYRVYATADEHYMAVGAIEPEFYAQLLQGLELSADELPTPMDKTNWPALAAIFEQRFKQKTRAQWEAVFADLDACVTPVLSRSEAPTHAQNIARNNFLVKGSRLRTNAAPRFNDTQIVSDASIYSPGAHTHEVLADLGYSDAKTRQLIRQGVVTAPDVEGEEK